MPANEWRKTAHIYHRLYIVVVRLPREMGERPLTASGPFGTGEQVCSKCVDCHVRGKPAAQCPCGGPLAWPDGHEIEPLTTRIRRPPSDQVCGVSCERRSSPDTTKLFITPDHDMKPS